MTNSKVTTVRFHMGGDDEIKTEHNRRDENTVKWEKHIDMDGKHEVLRDMELESVYEELFGRAIEEYDAKQKRRDTFAYDSFDRRLGIRWRTPATVPTRWTSSSEISNLRASR